MKDTGFRAAIMTRKPQKIYSSIKEQILHLLFRTILQPGSMGITKPWRPTYCSECHLSHLYASSIDERRWSIVNDIVHLEVQDTILIVNNVVGSSSFSDLMSIEVYCHRKFQVEYEIRCRWSDRLQYGQPAQVVILIETTRPVRWSTKHGGRLRRRTSTSYAQVDGVWWWDIAR